MRTELQQGAGLLVRFEDLHDNAHVMPNVRRLQGAVDSVFGTESTVHLYHATENASRALMPHTDPYDVIVMQLQGSKQWTTCVPGAQTVAPTSDSADPADDGDMASFTDAQLGQLQEIRRQRQQGCTSYTDENLRGMKCSTFTLNAGDTLYLPKGIIHYAIAQEGGSSHITISLERKGLAWADALLYGGLEAAHIIDTYEFQQRWQTAVSTVISDHRGVPYLEALPSWLTTGGQEHSDMCAAVADVHGDANLAAEAASSGGGIGDDARAFVETYGEMCRNMEPLLWGAYAQAQDLDGLFHHAEVRGIVDRVCSEEVALAVLSTLCTEQRLPHDVTARTARAAAGNEVCSGG